MLKAKNKIVTVGGRDISLADCSQEQLAILQKHFPNLIENDIPKPQRGKSADSPDAE